MCRDSLESIACARRDLLKAGAVGLTWGFFGLSLPQKLFLEEAYGITPDRTIQKYDAIVQIFYSGAPSQTDTWDVKADPHPAGYQSPNNVFPTMSLGKNDIYGQPIWISEQLSSIANLVNTNPTSYGLGIIRSMNHGIAVHAVGQSLMNCFWQSPVGNNYPSAAAVWSRYLDGQSGVGIPAVVVLGQNGLQVNDAKGANISTALNAPQPTMNAQGQINPSPIVAALNLPTGVDATRYARRQQIASAIDGNFSAARPDATIQNWMNAWKAAHDVTLQGKAAKAFDLTGVTPLPGGNKTAPDGSTVGSNQNELLGLTLAQELVTAGIPYVSCAIGGNDTHTGNMKGVTMNWGNITDTAVAKMAQNLQATGKRVLIVMGGEFGRTPNTVAPDAQGKRRDGRDHHAVGFSWSMLSINQPAFQTTAVGDTGPDGMWTTQGSPLIKDPIYPGSLGAMLYKVMGYDVGNDPNTNVPTALGTMAPPVDTTMATSTAPGNAHWLMQQFGLA